jgi:hypothetical protein
MYQTIDGKRVTQRDVSVEKLANGALSLGVVTDERLIRRTFYGYTRRDAVRLFCQEVNGGAY